MSVSTLVAAAAFAAAPASVEASTVPESLVASAVASVVPSSVVATTGVTETAIFLPPGFEVVAIVAAGLAGGMEGVRRGFDMSGVVTIAIVAGLGGGIMRDVLLQDYGIFALETPYALIGALSGALVAMFFLKAADKLSSPLLLLDALSLSLFCLVGADKALVAGMTPLSAILLGVLTAVGGGVLRDIMCDIEPQLLRRGGLYGSAAIAGSTLYVTMVAVLGLSKPFAMLVAAGVAIIMRMGSIWFGWESPEPVDLTDRVSQVPRSAVRAGRGLLPHQRAVRRRERAAPEDREPPRTHT